MKAVYNILILGNVTCNINNNSLMNLLLVGLVTAMCQIGSLYNIYCQ